MFNTVSLDLLLSRVSKRQTVDNTITPSELIAHCPPLFRHIRRHKAASRDGRLMAVSRPSSKYHVNVSYRETLTSARRC